MRFNQRFRSARQLAPAAGILLLAAAVLALPACGGLDEALTRAQQPEWRLAGYFQGRKIGHQTIRDRNGNIRQVARIDRVCSPVPAEQRGTCQDRIQYLYTAPGVPAALRLRDTLTWSVFYQTDQKSEVRFADGAGELSGHTRGASMLLSGTRRLPELAATGELSVPAPGAAWDAVPDRAAWLAAGPEASVKLRLHLRPDRLAGGQPVQRTLLQTERFFAWGLEIGTVETLWLDQN